MKLKKMFFSIIIVFMLVIVHTQIVKADMFPKATLEISVIYQHTDDIYIEFLQEKESVDSPRLDNSWETTDYPELYDLLIGIKFNGFASATFYGRPFGITKSKTITDNAIDFSVTYLYPKVFKLLVYDRTNKIFIISNVMTQKAFDAKMTFDLSNFEIPTHSEEYAVIDSNIDLNEIHNYSKSTTALIIRLVLTLFIEILILFLLNYRQKNSFVIVGIVNFVTQVSLTIALFISAYYYGPFFYAFTLIVGEIIIFIVETALYALLLKEKSRGNAVLYGITANTASLLLSFIKI